MLHVILTILKIIGILLLVLLALLILLVLAVLFAPVHYQVEAKYTEDSRKGDVRLFWLLHFLSVRLAYDLSAGEGGVKIRILGIDPQRVSGCLKRRKKRRKKKAAGSARPEKKNSSERAENPEETQQKRPEPEPEPERKDAGTKQEEPESGHTDQEARKKSPDKKRKKPGKKKSLYDRMAKFFKKQVYKLQGICDRIEKIRDSRNVLRETEQKAAWLLHHYRVRAGFGYLKFGTGDPSSTAELTGFLYILLPVSCGDIEIEPQFTESELETELSVRGHIRLIHLLRAILWGVFNRDLRQLIREFSGS